MYPLKFQPILKTLVWGGEQIAPYKEIETSLHNIGESWELSGVAGNESVVTEGPFAGRTITDLAAEYKGTLLGAHVYAATGAEFPLLIKFIDARSDLSIQVHPNDELAAARHNGSRGKTEMWYVVKAEPGAALLSGLSRAVTPDEYVRLVEENRITEVLNRYEVRAGDVFFLPAGRIHAIGAGIFLAEIQQTSDITYRIYDYGRLGLDGKPRQLHTAEAKDAIDYTVYPDCRTSYRSGLNEEDVLVDCKYFTTSLYTLDRAYHQDLQDRDSFVVVMCLEGRGTLTDTEPEQSYSIGIHQGETVLIPATSKRITFSPEGEGMKILTSYIR